MKRLAMIMGHSSTAVTEKYYTHLDKRDNAEALDAIAGGLGLTTMAPQKV